MPALILASGAPTACRAACARPVSRCATVARPMTGSRMAPAARDVRMAFFKFGGKDKSTREKESEYTYNTTREQYTYEELEEYFNYMGFLAEEGTYDRMHALGKDRHPADVILLLACAANDTPKVEELLKAGADPTVKDLEGKTSMDWAEKPELREMLTKNLAARA
ncbi:hypothetical protein HYH03_016019 [Edaphochlamys debaryana]|uniref:Uncharacterized protein n=1 Tax=Edaphochlamys debaryana TaxID=47281 RepID=A0A836BS15_9CHLO|nr:hypothetical protein HYH03_016019 [Edaphochlamys debaryana]|eukprot:KAG2485233.1 hypothetical protein HYH03_016019 [Edaphochlamys debaryana]